KLNDYQFDALHFTNALGTDLTVGLVENHVWAGGSELAQNGAEFNPNMPTEETFTMPHRERTHGVVVATKPLNYQGKLIEDFTLTFKDGKVIKATAKKEQATLDALLATDEGSAYLGEVALISHDSPISNMNLLFYNTLFDENASCHLALGRAYPMNIKDGQTMDEAELKAKGMNFSLNHEDFMFGSADMKIVGLKNDEEVLIFDQGNFVI
ncbi:MAG: aminopeptidase, partial [Erysipelothrix sp.]|nr:aminopeptidase [Erysipelothrix sp.]